VQGIQPHGLLPVGGHKGAQAHALEQLAVDPPHGVVIIDHQHAPGHPLQRGSPLARAVRSSAWPRHSRKGHPHQRALTGAALHPDASLVPADDPQHRAQPEAAALLFGGEKGIEHAGLGSLIHALARIAHLQPDVLARRQRLLCPVSRQPAGREPSCARGERDGARPPLERLGGIGQQIHHHLLKLARIAPHIGQVSPQMQLQRCRPRDRRPQDLAVLLHQRAEIDVRDDKMTLAGIGQHLAGEICGSHRRGDGLFQAHARARVRVQVQPGELQVAQDRRQQVVKVVPDATREDAKALQFLGLEQLPLHGEPFLLCSYPLVIVG